VGYRRLSILATPRHDISEIDKLKWFVTKSPQEFEEAGIFA
jgi:hypothetical protein